MLNNLSVFSSMQLKCSDCWLWQSRYFRESISCITNYEINSDRNIEINVKTVNSECEMLAMTK